MKLIHHMADTHGITDDALLVLITERHHLLDLAPIVIIEPGDTEEDIITTIGFSPLINRVDGARFPSPAFDPNSEYIAQYHGWYELVFVTSDDGAGVIMLIPERGDINADLLSLCRTYAEADDATAVTRDSDTG